MRNEKEESAVSVIGRLAGRLILVAVSVLVLFVAGRFAYQAGKDIFYQSPMEEAPGTDISVTIDEDTGYSELASLLKQKGIVDNETAVAVQARLYKTELYPGTYTLNTSMTTKEILTAINEAALSLKEADEAKSTEEESVLGGGDEEGAGHGQ